MAWKDQVGPGSQPRGDKEAADIATEAMGGQVKGKARAPHFHRMSIASAENGVSVEHTVEAPKRSRPKESGMSNTPSIGDLPQHTTKTHVFTSDHPMMKHVQALHDHMVGAAELGAGREGTD